MRKNVASQVIGAEMVNASDGTAFTGTASAFVTKDGGTQTAGGGTVTHKGNGYHSYALTQAETNADHVAVTFTGTGAIPATIQVYTNFPQTGDSFARLGAPAGASVSADVAAVKAQTAEIETDTQNIQARLPTALVSGRMDSSVGAMAADTITASALATSAVDEIVDGVWDELLTGASHNVPTSAGRRLRQLADISVVAEGAAQAGTSESITLEAGTDFPGAALRINYIRITSGTGVGQTRIISNWNNTTKVARVHRAWAITPDATSGYIIQSNSNIEVMDIGQVQGATATTITLNGGAPADNDALIGATVVILNGTGRDQQRIIIDYNGTTKVATIKTPWTTTPTTASDYVIFPYGRALLSDVTTEGASSLLSSTMAEGYAADGASMTLQQSLHMIYAMLAEKSVAGTTMTVKRLDGTTTAMEFTLNDATSPTSITRSS